MLEDFCFEQDAPTRAEFDEWDELNERVIYN